MVSKEMQHMSSVGGLSVVSLGLSLGVGFTSQWPWGSLSSTIGLAYFALVLVPLCFLRKHRQTLMHLVPVGVALHTGTALGLLIVSTYNGEWVGGEATEAPLDLDALDLQYAHWLSVVFSVCNALVLGGLLYLSRLFFDFPISKLGYSLNSYGVIHILGVMGIAVALDGMWDAEHIPTLSKFSGISSLISYFLILVVLCTAMKPFNVQKYSKLSMGVDVFLVLMFMVNGGILAFTEKAVLINAQIANVLGAITWCVSAVIRELGVKIDKLNEFALLGSVDHPSVDSSVGNFREFRDSDAESIEDPLKGGSTNFSAV